MYQILELLEQLLVIGNYEKSIVDNHRKYVFYDLYVNGNIIHDQHYNHINVESLKQFFVQNDMECIINAQYDTKTKNTTLVIYQAL